MRFYLVDRITSLNLGSTITGIKCWTMTDRIFEEHFPGFPVVPGVLLIESCAQLLGILIEKSYAESFANKEKVYVMLSMVHKAKFKEMVQPGDRCEITGVLKTLDYNRASGKAEIMVDGESVTEVELSFVLVPQSIAPKNELVNKRSAEYVDIILQKKNKKDLT